MGANGFHKRTQKQKEAAQRDVLRALRGGPCSPLELRDTTGLTISHVRTALRVLVANRLIEATGSKTYQLREGIAIAKALTDVYAGQLVTAAQVELEHGGAP